MNFPYKELEKNKLIINIMQIIKLYDMRKKYFFLVNENRGYIKQKIVENFLLYILKI